MLEAPAAAWSAETARAYQALCSLCSWALLVDPEKERLEALARDRAMFAEPPFSQVAPEAAAEFAETLVPFITESAADEAFSAIHRDRTYLFYMVGQSRTSPFESVYRTDDATMFGPTTLEVREAYRAQGLQFDRSDSEPDDHIGLELSFAAHLLGRAADELEGGTAANSMALASLAEFLSKHVLVFAPVYLENVRVRAKTAYYRGVAEMTQATLAALAASLGAKAVEEIDSERFR